MAFWWLLVVVALAFLIYKFLLARVPYNVLFPPFFGRKTPPAAADAQASDVVESDDGNQSRGESHGDGKQGNGSGKGTSEIETKAEDFINRFKQQLKLQRLESIARYKEILKTPTSANISERGKGKEVSVEEKSGTEKVVSKSLKMSGPVSQEGEGIDNSIIEKFTTSTNISERGKGKEVSVEEKSGTGKLVSISSEMSGPVSPQQEGSDNSRYDSTGKLLPINFGKQREQIPTVEENIDVRANIIFLDRDYLEESDAHIPSQRETSLPTVSPTSSTQGEESRPEGQNKMEADPKKRRWFKPFSWWQKK